MHKVRAAFSSQAHWKREDVPHTLCGLDVLEGSADGPACILCQRARQRAESNARKVGAQVVTIKQMAAAPLPNGVIKIIPPGAIGTVEDVRGGLVPEYLVRINRSPHPQWMYASEIRFLQQAP